jgi:hypothetical protein
MMVMMMITIGVIVSIHQNRLDELDGPAIRFGERSRKLSNVGQSLMGNQ